MPLSAGIVSLPGFGPTQTVGKWSPGQVGIPDYADIVIGQWIMPFGPRILEYTRQPNVARQLTINAVILYDYGWMPNQYVMEGYPNGGRLEEMQQFMAQFGDDPIAAVPFIAPVLGIKDVVRFTRFNPRIDATSAWKEPYYRLEMESAGGGYTDLSNGIVPVGATS